MTSFPSKEASAAGANVLRVAVDCDRPLRVAVQLELPGQIFLRPRPGDGHVPADEIALRGLVHVGAELRAVVKNHG